MRVLKVKSEQGNVLLCVLCTILIVSIIGGNVLLNRVTRFNTASSQVRGWKEALYAAESGGDIAYAEVRKTVLDPTHAFTGWSNSGGVYSNSPITFGKDNLTTSGTADLFYYDSNGNPDVTGAIVCKTYYGNGNTSVHYDRALGNLGDAVDYRVISYVEDIR